MENNIFLQNIWEPGDVREIRVMGKDGRIYSGYFNDPELAKKAIEKYENGNFVYTTLNPVHPGLMARRGNKLLQIKAEKESSTSDKDIRAINFCYIDVDPNRPSGISSSDAEKSQAQEIAQKVMDEIGRPFIFGDSGNGYHLIYRSNAKNANETKLFLVEMQKRFGTDAVGIDQKVFNPARITKVLGTWAIKGENIPERPWRKSSVIFVDLQSAKLDLSQYKPATPSPLPIPKSSAQAICGTSDPFDVRKFLSDHGVIVRNEKPWNDATMLVLESCVFDPSHKKDASVIIHPDGKLSYQCFHDSCKGKTWDDLRDAVGDPKKEKQCFCKTCGTPMFWTLDGEKWIAMENETTRHFCNNRKKQVATKKESNPAIVDVLQGKKPRKQRKFDDAKRKSMPLPGDETILVQIPDDSGVGYVVTNLAVYEKKTFLNEFTNEVIDSYRRIIDQPARIEEVIKDVWSSDESVSIRWGEDERQRAVFPVEAVSFSKHVDKLSAKGIRVNSNNTKETIAYFAAALARDKKIKTKLSSYKNGWLDGHRFILGSRILEQATESEIEFQGSTYVPEIKGTEEEWKKTVAEFKNDIGLAIRLGSAAISPVLKIIGCSSYIDHLWGGSTSGKTFSSIVAASMFGDPFRLVESWRQSRSGKETYFEEAGGLPSFLDESHQAKPEDLEQTVYDFANEKGKGRATITTGGEVRKAKSKTWFGVLLSTGEGQIKECTQKAGVEARGMEFQRVTEISEEVGKRVTKAKNVLRLNHGHLVEKILKLAMVHGSQLKEFFENYIEMLLEHSSNNLQSRQVPYLAATLVGCKILDLLGVDIAAEDGRVEYVLNYMSSEIPVPTWKKAYDFIQEQAGKNAHRFWVVDKSPFSGSEITTPPKDQCWGRISDKWIDIFPDQTRILLKDGGFDMSVIQLLKSEGKIISKGDRNTVQAKISIGGESRVLRVIRFLREELDEETEL